MSAQWVKYCAMEQGLGMCFGRMGSGQNNNRVMTVSWHNVKFECNLKLISLRFVVSGRMLRVINFSLSVDNFNL